MSDEGNEINEANVMAVFMRLKILPSLIMNNIMNHDSVMVFIIKIIILLFHYFNKLLVNNIG